MDPVEAAATRIRDLVNSPRRVHYLLKNKQRWFQLCSAMDTIGDTQMAVRAYLKEVVRDASDGFSYLIVYGVLQVLYVQQNAAKTLAMCLKVPFKLSPEVEGIRRIRDSAVGHPAEKGAFISRSGLSAKGFSYHFGMSRRTGVDLPAVAEQQTQLMGALLERVLEQLVSEELAHRRKFRARRIRQSLPDSLSYYAVKIAEGLRDPSVRPLALGGIATIRKGVAACQSMLDERGLTEPCKDSIGRTASEIEFALGRLESRLNGGAKTWTAADEDVYWWYLHTKITELQQLTDEIDREYDSDDVTR